MNNANYLYIKEQKSVSNLKLFLSRLYFNVQSTPDLVPHLNGPFLRFFNSTSYRFCKRHKNQFIGN
jgi:hypothetical protein